MSTHNRLGGSYQQGYGLAFPDGVTPYQIGFENEEAIESGAFWFYRKLGFRPGRPDLAALCEAEEKKIARDKKHRTSARNLRRLAEGFIFYETPEAVHKQWDDFRTRYLGMNVNQYVGERFAGNVSRYRIESSEFLAKVLGCSRDDFKGCASNRAALVGIIGAKAAAEEWEYLRLMREHDPLRDVFLRLGAEQRTPKDTKEHEGNKRSLDSDLRPRSG